MNFHEAIEMLGIEKYRHKILTSNSHGELFHLQQYVEIAEAFKDDKRFLLSFPKWFDAVVKAAEEKWERPQSVYQHILKILRENLE